MHNPFPLLLPSVGKIDKSANGLSRIRGTGKSDFRFCLCVVYYFFKFIFSLFLVCGRSTNETWFIFFPELWTALTYRQIWFQSACSQWILVCFFDSAGVLFSEMFLDIQMLRCCKAGVLRTQVDSQINKRVCTLISPWIFPSVIFREETNFLFVLIGLQVI